MYVINGKRISMVLMSLLIGVFVYLFEVSKVEDNSRTQMVVSTPVSGKVIVVDAGHRKTWWGDLFVNIIIATNLLRLNKVFRHFIFFMQRISGKDYKMEMNENKFTDTTLQERILVFLNSLLLGLIMLKYFYIKNY